MFSMAVNWYSIAQGRVKKSRNSFVNRNLEKLQLFNML